MATLTGKKFKNYYKSLFHFEDELAASSTKKVVQDGDGNALPFKVSTSNFEFTGGVDGLDKNDVGLSNVDNTSDADKPVSTLQAAADLTAENNAKAYADTLVVGLIDDRGNYDASGNVFPSSGGSGTAGAIKKGDLYTISVAGTLGGNAVTPGDLVRALVDTPGQTSSNWAVTENNIGYVAENSTNKDATGGYVGLTGFKIKIKNAAGTITSLISSLASTAREWILPDKNMTIAGLDDTTLSADASGTDTYTATITPAITAYSNTQRFYIKFPNANTGAATLNLNSLGAKSIKKNGNTDLAATDIKTGQIYCLAYDGTNFQILTWIGAAGGGGDMLASNNLSEVNPATAKNNLGLNNVDNTSDSNKPVSTLQAAADLTAENNAKAYADGKVEDLLVNGVTTKAPSQNIVFDQLALKQDSLGFTAENTANKGVAGGYAGLDGSGKVPSAQLPSFVDDVIEAANFAALPGTGETGKIYVTLDNNKTFRWSGSAYVEISASPGSTDSVTEGATNLYHTAARVLATVLTGVSLATNAAITASDTVLSALGKLQKQITDLTATVGGIVSATLANLASAFHGASSKTPVDADEVAGMNSAASFAGVRYTWTNIKSFLKAYFDTIYQAAGAYLTASNIDDTAYNETSWNGVTGNAPSKNAVRDEFENRLTKAAHNKTIIKLISNWTLMPDSSGNTFLEPASVKQTNDRYPGVVAIFKDSGNKTGIGFYDIVPADYVGSASLGIVWGSVSTLGSNAVLGFDYNSGALASTLDVSSDTETVSATVADSTTTMMGVVTEIAITSGNLTPNGKIEGIAWRNSGGSDNLAADVVVKAIYLKYNNY
jgi:hypothetical protein